MHILSLILIALAMSTDAFAVAISRGVALKKPSFSMALRNGLLFGLVEALTPLLGWLLGALAASYVSAWDHWVVFGLLAFLGVKMIRNGLARHAPQKEQKPGSWWLALVVAVTTSMDSFALGISLAFADVNIALAAALIGLATCTMVTLGIMLGRKLGELTGKKAEIIGGVILILLGLATLYEHLFLS